MEHTGKMYEQEKLLKFLNISELVDAILLNGISSDIPLDSSKKKIIVEGSFMFIKVFVISLYIIIFKVYAMIR